jgi:tryptophan-rich sensory protein
MTTALFLKAEKWAVALTVPFLAWTTYLSYSGINITRIT